MKEAVCRLCLAVVDPDDSGCSVLNDRFRQALEIVFTFEIRVAEDLPVYTCKQCSWNVLDFRTFSELVKQNQETLEKGLPLNVESKSTTGEDTLTTDEVCNDDINEEKATNNIDKTTSQEKHPVYTNTTPTDDDLSSDDLKVAFEIHPDHDSLTMVEEDADNLCLDMICEEYVITTSETEENSNYTTMETAIEKNILPARERSVEESENDVSDADEPAQKKKKLSTLESISARENNAASDSYNASSNVHQEAVHVLNEQADEMHPCEKCDKKYVSKWQLEYHKQDHMVFKCLFCRKTVPAKTLNAHVSSHQDSLSCKKCKKKFINHRDYTLHRKSCTKDCHDRV